MSYPTEVRQLTSYKPPPGITKDILYEIKAKLFCCFTYVKISKRRRKKSSDQISLHLKLSKYSRKMLLVEMLFNKIEQSLKQIATLPSPLMFSFDN